MMGTIGDIINKWPMRPRGDKSIYDWRGVTLDRMREIALLSRKEFGKYPSAHHHLWWRSMDNRLRMMGLPGLPALRETSKTGLAAALMKADQDTAHAAVLFIEKYRKEKSKQKRKGKPGDSGK